MKQIGKSFFKIVYGKKITWTVIEVGSYDPDPVSQKKSRIFYNKDGGDNG